MFSRSSIFPEDSIYFHSIEFMTWIRKYIRKKQWDVITQPRPPYYGGLDGWVIISHSK